MTPNEINKEIALLCGTWTSETQRLVSLWPDAVIARAMNRHIPNYYSDLNAMHEAEKMLDTLPMDTRSLWYDYLGLIVGWNKASNQADMRFECGYLSARATAAQRAEAFLRVHGKWHEAGNEHVSRAPLDNPHPLG